MAETNNGQWEQFKRDRFSSRWKKKLQKLQLVISVFGNHAASRDGDDYLIYLYNIAPESNI